jgi:hypothetical protein
MNCCHPSVCNDCHKIADTLFYSPCYNINHKYSQGEVMMGTIFSGAMCSMGLHAAVSSCAASAVASDAALSGCVGSVVYPFGAVACASILPLCTPEEEERDWSKAKPNNCYRALICCAATSAEVAVTGSIALSLERGAAVAFKVAAASAAAGLGAIPSTILCCECCCGSGIRKQREEKDRQNKALIEEGEANARFREAQQELERHLRRALEEQQALVPPPVAITMPQYQSLDSSQRASSS